LEGDGWFIEEIQDCWMVVFDGETVGIILLISNIFAGDGSIPHTPPPGVRLPGPLDELRCVCVRCAAARLEYMGRWVLKSIWKWRNASPFDSTRVWLSLWNQRNRKFFKVSYTHPLPRPLE
jgi:hypothetical protein